MTKIFQKKSKVNSMHILILDSVKKFSANRGILVNPIIYFERKPCGDDIKFKHISEETLVEKITNGKYFVCGFESGNFDHYPIEIRYFKYDAGTVFEVDKKKVPAFIDKKCNCCFVCQEKDIPSSILGEWNDCLIEYDTKNKEEGIIFPYVKYPFVKKIREVKGELLFFLNGK